LLELAPLQQVADQAIAFRIVDLEALDAIVEDEVLSRFARRTLNDDEAFRRLVPTAENIARVIYEKLAPAIAERSSAELVRVDVRETGKNTFAYGAIQ